MHVDYERFYIVHRVSDPARVEVFVEKRGGTALYVMKTSERWGGRDWGHQSPWPFFGSRADPFSPPTPNPTP